MTILLYDDDCGICTKFTRIISRLRPNLTILPMHEPRLRDIGIEKIGVDNYWKSFHIVENGVWTDESDAITSLARIFPFGRILSQITIIKPVRSTLLNILRKMQHRRKLECKL